MTRKSAKAAEASSSASSPEPTGSLDDSMFDGSVDVTNAESWMSRSYEDAEPPVNVNRPFAFKNQNYKPPKKPRFPKAIVTQEKAIPAPVNAVRYWSIDAPPSLLPQKKYCDLTGLEAKYTDPKTGLRYHSADCFIYVRKLSPAQVQQHLGLRNAAAQIK